MKSPSRHFIRLAAAVSAVLLLGFAPAPSPSPSPSTVPAYSIQAIRYGTIRSFPVSALVMGAPEEEKIDIAMVVWLIRDGGHNVLFDSGFHREVWLEQFPTAD